MPLSGAITRVDDNDNGSSKTDNLEYPDYGADNLCEYHDVKTDKEMDNVEAEYDDTSDRSDNIELSDNGEVAVLDKIVTNIYANSAKSETTETTGVGYVEISGPNAISTEIWTS